VDEDRPLEADLRALTLAIERGELTEGDAHDRP
jgi:histidine ammonia-lyase